MSKLTLKMLLLVLAPTSVALPCLFAQQAPAPAPMATVADAPQQYARPDLDMTYTPPAGWKPQDISLIKSQGGDDKTANCMKFLYIATPESDAKAVGGITVGVTIIDSARSCVSKETTADAQVQSVVENSKNMPGMKVYKSPTAYFLDGHTFWALISKGKPQLTNGTGANEEVYLAIVGAVVKDHVILWEMAAPDQPMLQQMLNSTVQFTGKKPHMLYKVNLK